MSKSKKDLIIENYENIKKWLSEGLYEYQIYDNLGIGKTTWSKYKNELLELQDILSNGNDTQVVNVTNSAYDLATGYDYTEDVAFKCKAIYYDENGKKCSKEYVETARVKRHQPPKEGMTRWWLMNRDKSNWLLNPHESERKAKEFKERMEKETDDEF